MYKKPTSLTAARAFTIHGVAVAKGQTIAGPFPRTFQALIARRWVYPTPPTYGPIGDQTTPTPTFIHHKLLAGLTGAVGPL